MAGYRAYVLRSLNTGQYYVGSTEDLERRVREHNGELPRLGRATVSGRPWELVFQAEFTSRSQALAAERYIKRMKSRVWIDKLVSGEYGLPKF
jgi:putative endonuclease